MSDSHSKNVAWSVILFWSRFGINAAILVIIARWISAAELGIYGAILSIIQIIQIIQMTGLPEATMKRAEGTQRELVASSAFWLSLGFGAAGSLLFYLSKSLFVAILGPVSAGYVNFLCVLPMLMGAGAVSESMIRQELRLDKLAVRTTFALTIAGGLCIYLAAVGWQGYALVAFSITNAAIATFFNLTVARWRPQFLFDRKAASLLLKDAVTISASNAFKATITPVSQFTVTILLGPTAGGIYLIATRISGMIFSLTIMPAQYAALPIFIKIKEGPQERAKAFITACAVMSTISAPIYAGVIVIMPMILPPVLGEVATEVYPVVVAFFLHTPVMVLANLGLPLLIAAGFSRHAMAFTGLQALLNIPLILWLSSVSLPATGWALGLGYYLISPYLLYLLKKDADISTFLVIKAVGRPWIASMMMAGFINVVQKWWLTSYHLFLQILGCSLIGILLFTLICSFLSHAEFVATISSFKNLVKRRSK